MMDGDLLANLFPSGLALALIGGGFAVLRYLPELLMNSARRMFMTTVTTRDHELSRWLSAWILRTDYGDACKWIDAEVMHETNELQAIKLPGLGVHTFVHDGRRYWLTRQLEEQGAAGLRLVISISTIGTSREAIDQLIDMALELANSYRRGRNAIYVSRTWGGWEMVRLFDLRPKDTIFLDGTVVEDVLADARWFWNSPDWYAERGLPHRRGYILYGPPGNGKSTLAQVLATEAKMPIYLLSMTAEKFDDEVLISVLGNLPSRCILLIEDLEKIDFDRIEVSLSGLLNAIDGPLASNGRLLIVTANDMDAINPIILRPGRIDRQIRIAEPSMATLKACADRFGINSTDTNSLIAKAVADKWSMAQFQQELLVSVEAKGLME